MRHAPTQAHTQSCQDAHARPVTIDSIPFSDKKYSGDCSAAGIIFIISRPRIHAESDKYLIRFGFNGSVHHYYTAFALSHTQSTNIQYITALIEFLGRLHHRQTLSLSLEPGDRCSDEKTSKRLTSCALNAVFNSYSFSAVAFSSFMIYYICGIEWRTQFSPVLRTSLEYLAVNHLNKTSRSKPMNMKLSRLIDKADIVHRTRTVNALKI